MDTELESLEKAIGNAIRIYDPGDIVVFFNMIQPQKRGIFGYVAIKEFITKLSVDELDDPENWGLEFREDLAQFVANWRSKK